MQGQCDLRQGNIFLYLRPYVAVKLTCNVKQQFRQAVFAIRFRRKASIFVRKTLQVRPRDQKMRMHLLSSQRGTCVFRRRWCLRRIRNSIPACPNYCRASYVLRYSLWRNLTASPLVQLFVSRKVPSEKPPATFFSYAQITAVRNAAVMESLNGFLVDLGFGQPL